MRRAALLAAGLLLFAAGAAAADERVLGLARAQKEPFLATLKGLVEIESGSFDREGLDRIAGVIAARLAELGATVEMIEGPADAASTATSPPRPGRTVVGTFKGRGTRSILLLAHMDTVYQKGDLARQPFRVEGDRAYGLGISDDKQAIAMLIHAAAMLKSLGFDDYGRLTLAITGDEEVGSYACRDLLTRLGSEHDVVLSFEASSESHEQVSMVTSGLAQAHLTVRGQSAHAANFPPSRGVNALDELAFQLVQLRDLHDFAHGLRLTWAVAKAGTVPNRIPDEASAIADIRVLRVAQIDELEKRMREIVARQLLPGAKVELAIVRGRPPLEARPASRAVAEHARSINAEIGRALRINDDQPQGGTDAAYAGLKARGAVLEHWGAHGANAHSSRNEYIVVSSIERRLYLVVRTIMDLSLGKVALPGS
jgi:glutamate carboxypeptidase